MTTQLGRSSLPKECCLVDHSKSSRSLCSSAGTAVLSYLLLCCDLLSMSAVCGVVDVSLFNAGCHCCHQVIIITTTMFIVLSSWQSHCESSPGSSDECRMAPSGRRPKTKPNDLGCESTCTGCQKLHPPSAFIIITQPES